MILTLRERRALERWFEAWPSKAQEEIQVSDRNVVLTVAVFLRGDCDEFGGGARVWGPKCWSCHERYTWYLNDLMEHQEPPAWQLLADDVGICTRCATRECVACKRKVTSSKQEIRSASLRRISLCERCAPTPLNLAPMPSESRIPKWRPKL